MSEQSFPVGDPAMRVEPMPTPNGPGWSVDVADDDGELISSYDLWAPRTDEEAAGRGCLGPGRARQLWAAAWTMRGGRDGDFQEADSPSVALAVFASCPRRQEATAAAMALLDAAHQHTAASADLITEEE